MKVARSTAWIGIALILSVGLIHLVDAPDSMSESVAKGISFYLNAAAAVLAAIGIYKAKISWGWGLGAVVSVGAFIGYVVSRTVGIFGIPPDVWMEPIGILSLIVEALFLVFFIYTTLSPKPVTATSSG